PQGLVPEISDHPHLSRPDGRTESAHRERRSDRTRKRTTEVGAAQPRPSVTNRGQGRRAAPQSPAVARNLSYAFHRARPSSARRADRWNDSRRDGADGTLPDRPQQAWSHGAGGGARYGVCSLYRTPRD